MPRYYDNEDAGDLAAMGAADASAEGYLIDGVGFADPGGRSALRAATRHNPRTHACPTCGEPDMLTPADVRKGYQCDKCADQDEGGMLGW